MTELVKSSRNGPFAEALADLAGFFNGYHEATLSAARVDGRVDDVPIVDILGRALIEQSVQLNNRLVTFYDTEEASELAVQLDEYAEATALPMLAKSAAEFVAPQAAARSSNFLGGLLGGIVDILEPIKKILKIVLQKFPIGGFLGKIIDILLDIINNLLQNNQSRLGEPAAVRASAARATMYEHLQQIYTTDAAAALRRKALNAEEVEKA
ncbi:hypothetical protein GCM10023115_00460 [Pontixanthobacter gangjinensis]|uniref:Uncharacterized protein n=1 Tax=Pontixanthobacter gangjinensis TaxID=1028742 RepID=A0A6I4SJL0_9SPHN|nr:hypothetical protein [Pontixanthobacter gangjinensis]MXO55300.1 hypothetical protein [Pontixanthobacter gangjinensis]